MIKSTKSEKIFLIILTTFQNTPDSKELKLTFKYATSIQALDVVMKLLFGFEDVLIPNEEYIQVLTFLEELSNYINALKFIMMIRNKLCHFQLPNVNIF